MNNKPTVFGTVAGMTALIGVLPLLLTMVFEPYLSALALTLVHLTLMAAGTWLFTEWF